MPTLASSAHRAVEPWGDVPKRVGKSSILLCLEFLIVNFLVALAF